MSQHPFNEVTSGLKVSASFFLWLHSLPYHTRKAQREDKSFGLSTVHTHRNHWGRLTEKQRKSPGRSPLLGSAQILEELEGFPPPLVQLEAGFPWMLFVET